MAFDIEVITNSSLGVSLFSALAAAIPRSIGYRIADVVARRIASQRESRLTRAVRLNQWVVRGEHPSPTLLDEAVRQTLRNSARSVFDLYHSVGNLKALEKWIVLDGDMRDLVKRPEFADRGLMILGIHLSHFDLLLRWFSQKELRLLVLTVPDAKGGRRTEYEMRAKIGMRLAPGTVGGLRRALRHLQQGGVVLTGIDRPIPEPKLQPRFFGRAAALPTHYIHLATRADVPVRVIVPLLGPDGRYHIRLSEPLEMEGGDRSDAAVLRNAEAALQKAEAFIREAPEHWSVPLPVWPSAATLVP